MLSSEDEKKQTLLSNSISKLLDCCKFIFSRSNEEKQMKKKTLVLDLDETLVHAQFQKPLFYDFILELFVFDFSTKVYINIRPYALQFIEEMNTLYDIVLFTASMRQYAEEIMDYVDPKRLSKLRLFRENCTNYNGYLVKDLNIFQQNLEDIVVIDNNRQSYMFQPSNGIQILNYYDNKQDTELRDLIPFLKDLVSHKDVRPVQSKLQMYQMQNLMLQSQKNSEEIESAQSSSEKHLLKTKGDLIQNQQIINCLQGDLDTEVDRGSQQIIEEVNSPKKRNKIKV